MPVQPQAEAQKKSKEAAPKRQSVARPIPSLLTEQTATHTTIGRAMNAPHSMVPTDVLNLQRVVGNQALGQMADVMKTPARDSYSPRRFPLNAMPPGTEVQLAPDEFDATPDSVTQSLPPEASTGPMTREQFEQTVQQRFGLSRVYTGTFEEQVARLNRLQQPGDQLDATTWSAWDPGSSSPVYQWIVSAFAEFANTFGGVPAVQAIGFYDTDYGQDRNGNLRAKRDVAADYSGGHLSVYRVATDASSDKRLPIGRSNATDTEPLNGQSPGAPLDRPTEEQDMLRIVTHELGHGLIETAMTPPAVGDAPDPTMMNDYRRMVGWTESNPAALFDIGNAAVQSALASGNRPAVTYQITKDNWRDPHWQEQPVSSYMVAEGPHEDFPEAVMAYINEPALLRQRSPRRYAFLESHKATWLPYLYRSLVNVEQPTPPMGDFPEPRGESVAV